MENSFCDSFNSEKNENHKISKLEATEIGATTSTVHYLAGAKELRPESSRKKIIHFHSTTIGLIYNAAKQKGILFIPRHIVQPLLANWLVGFSLFTTFTLSQPFFFSAFNTNPDSKPGFFKKYSSDFLAGFTAGAVQSIVATPLDNMKYNLDVKEVLNGKHKSHFQFYRHQLSIGNMGSLYKGFNLVLFKDSISFALFFGTYEYSRKNLLRISDIENTKMANGICTVLSGAISAIVYQAVDYPISQFMSIVEMSSNSLKIRNLDSTITENTIKETPQKGIYRNAWKELMELVKMDEVIKNGSDIVGGTRILYRGWYRMAIRSVPATSIGLVFYEIFKDLIT
ncbi:hypothetical protein BB559_006628 [Furculomyces boomerangus]|uniref:Mitochondrial carrier protein n=1 Tax=Furculomyces boomerangus TaxID=61424 RepID=A0A2T9Y1H6_9FUNG|nr:hypothetical protein BB559_006628 [Furculomyces boomerangus]